MRRSVRQKNNNETDNHMNKRNAKTLLGLLICTALVGTSVPANAQLLTLVEPSEKGYRGTRDSIEVRFGQDMPADLIPYLRLELDAIDVTDFVQSDSQRLLFLPQVSLEAGMHELRVVAVLPDGSIEEAAVWTLQIRASRDLEVASFNSNVNLRAMQRVSDDLDNPPEERQQGQGSLGWESRHANDDWEVTSHANIIYNSQRDQNLSGEALDLTDYQVRNRMKNGEIVLGHQLVSPGSLVLTDFNRRGLSASYHSDQQRFQATGFSTRTEEITGFDNLVGLEDSNNVSNGVIVAAYPFEAQPRQLAIAAVYMESQGVSQGVAQVNDNLPNTGGDAAAIIVDSYPGNQRWQLRGEYATTSFDFDGENTGYAAEEDDAVSLLVGYDTSRDTDSAATSTWNLNLTHQRVGPWFYSLGNTGVTVDRETTQLAGNYQGIEFGMNGTVSLGQDNVDNIDTLPTTDIDTATLNFIYTPQSAEYSQPATDQESSSGGLFSNPSYSLGWSMNRLDQNTFPTGYTGDEINSQYQELTLAATFSGSDWYWSVNQSWVKQDDKVIAANVSDTLATSIESQFSLNPYLSLSPVLQQSVTDYSNIGIETKSWLTGLTMNLNYPEDWSNSLSYTVNRETANDGTIDNRTRIAELILQWNFRQAGENKTGISFFTSASHQQLEQAGTDTDQYQAFVGVNIVWPATL
jgi:hypothetical protein